MTGHRPPHARPPAWTLAEALEIVLDAAAQQAAINRAARNTGLADMQEDAAGFVRRAVLPAAVFGTSKK